MPENRKVKLTKKVLKESLVELLCKKNIPEITVTELCHLADVNRSTFYSHYETLMDVLDDIENDFIQHIPYYNSKQVFLQEKKRFVTYITYIEKHRETFLVLLKNGKLIEKIYYDAVNLIDINTADKMLGKYRFVTYYACHGTFQMIAHWLKDNKGYSAEDLAQLMLNLIIQVNESADTSL